MRGSQDHRGALDVASRQQDYRSLGSGGPRGKRLAPSTRQCARHGVLVGPASPQRSPGPTRLTMATLSRLPTVRTVRDSRSRGCVSTRSEMVRSVAQAGQHLCGITESSHPAPAPDKAEPAGGLAGGNPQPKGPAHRGAPLGSLRALCPGLRTRRCTDKRDTPPLGPCTATATATWGPLAGLGKWGSQEKPQEHSVTVLEAGGAGLRWARLSREGPQGRGTGVCASMAPTPGGHRPTHSPRTDQQSTVLAPAPAHRPQAQRTAPEPPSWREGET